MSMDLFSQYVPKALVGIFTLGMMANVAPSLASQIKIVHSNQSQFLVLE